MEQISRCSRHPVRRTVGRSAEDRASIQNQQQISDTSFCAGGGGRLHGRIFHPASLDTPESIRRDVGTRATTQEPFTAAMKRR